MGRLFASILPLLAVLACPVMMLLCLRAMRGHGSQQQLPETSTRTLTDSTTERITALERELAELRANHDHTVEQPPPSAGPPASFPARSRVPAKPSEPAER
jgi:hypothetical protein